MQFQICWGESAEIDTINQNLQIHKGLKEGTNMYYRVFRRALIGTLVKNFELVVIQRPLKKVIKKHFLTLFTFLSESNGEMRHLPFSWRDIDGFSASGENRESILKVPSERKVGLLIRSSMHTVRKTNYFSIWICFTTISKFCWFFISLRWFESEKNCSFSNTVVWG